MTKPTTAAASKLSVWLGNGASPEVFAAPCGLTTRGINFGAGSNDTTVPDCTDPDAPAWLERVIASLQAGVSGSGVLALEAQDTWEDFFFGGVAKNCRVVIDWGSGGLRRYDGSFVCTTLDIGGQLGGKVTVSIALQSNGEVARVVVP